MKQYTYYMTTLLFSKDSGAQEGALPLGHRVVATFERKEGTDLEALRALIEVTATTPDMFEVRGSWGT